MSTFFLSGVSLATPGSPTPVQITVSFSGHVEGLVRLPFAGRDLLLGKQGAQTGILPFSIKDSLGHDLSHLDVHIHNGRWDTNSFGAWAELLVFRDADGRWSHVVSVDEGYRDDSFLEAVVAEYASLQIVHNSNPPFELRHGSDLAYYMQRYGSKENISVSHDDTLIYHRGNDTHQLTPGWDWIDGERGSDHYVADGKFGEVTHVNMRRGEVYKRLEDGTEQTDTLLNFEVISLGAGDQSFLGGAAAMTVYGGDGQDRLQGGQAHDRLYGESGDD